MQSQRQKKNWEAVQVKSRLERMKKMLESNKAMQTLVSGEAGEVNE